MRPLFNRFIAALLVLAFSAPAGALCAPAAAGGSMAGAMAGMPCCKKLPPSDAGTMEQNCCRINERLPERAPASSVPARTILQDGSTLAPVTAFSVLVTTDVYAHRDLAAARGRPGTPTYLRTSVLLI